MRTACFGGCHCPERRGGLCPEEGGSLCLGEGVSVSGVSVQEGPCLGISIRGVGGLLTDPSSQRPPFTETALRHEVTHLPHPVDRQTPLKALPCGQYQAFK